LIRFFRTLFLTWKTLKTATRVSLESASQALSKHTLVAILGCLVD
jgi:hypothetical protein